ncbi:hypothetical protein M440DRAFT_1406009 [Trichoderma longibrachiatum ATCC 18648]|uniref:Uncharacterized protein n=1 Tax=Trichoderma longibrachiatum ATCC 18648 TaxID=983965 RepID=A0A2T4BRQ3_TRILO|nr:hypothetical protein M440DRAFT_1406009 [Trichoderma longibrachiatum ATCC 18648]
MPLLFNCQSQVDPNRPKNIKQLPRQRNSQIHSQRRQPTNLNQRVASPARTHTDPVPPQMTCIQSRRSHQTACPPTLHINRQPRLASWGRQQRANHHRPHSTDGRRVESRTAKCKVWMDVWSSTD